jgi:hypothetical protein
LWILRRPLGCHQKHIISCANLESPQREISSPPFRRYNKTWSISSRFSRIPPLFGYIFFSSNRIEIFLVAPENESDQQKVAYSLANSVVFAKKKNYQKSPFRTYNRADGHRP